MSDISDLFSSENPFSQIGGETGVPSIGDVKSDMINFYNIGSGKAKAADWGAGIGGATGFALGGPAGAQFGANVGRLALPILNKVAGPVIDTIGSGIKGAASGIGDAFSSIGDAVSK